MAKVFISHAAADKVLVDRIFDLLQTGCSLRTEDIFCSSVEGAGIKTGADFVLWVEQHLAASALTILVLSLNYYASQFCMAEMGAAWALRKAVFPLMLPSVPSDPGVVLLGRQSSRLDETGIHELRDRIAEFHNPGPTARWSIKKDEFLEDLPRILRQLPLPDSVQRAELERERERKVAATELYKEAEAEARKLREQVSLLEKAKDADEVRHIRTSTTPVVDAYENLRQKVRSDLDDFERVEVRGLYASIAGEEWRPSGEAQDLWSTEINKAVRREWLVQHEYLDHVAYSSNTEHPRYRRIVKLLSELETAIRALPEEVRLGLELDCGYLINIENWQFWEEGLLDHWLLE